MNADRDLERRIADLDPAASVTVPASLARSILERAGASATSADTPPAVAPSRVARRSGPLLAAAAALAVLTAGTVAAVEGLTGGRGGPPAGPASSAAPTGPVSSAEPTPAPSPAPAVAPGWQRISSFGLEVDVPASWQTNPWDGCGPAPASGVFRGPRLVPRCGGRDVVMSSLTIEDAGTAPTTAAAAGDAVPAPPGAPSSERVVGQGVRAWVEERTGPRGRAEISVAVPARRVRAVITGTDSELLRRILSTVRVVTVDTAGCSTDQPEDPAWVRRPAAGRPVTARDLVEVAVCSYTGGVLSASIAVTGAGLSSLVAAIERAPAGTVPGVPDGRCGAGQADPSPVWLMMKHDDGSITPARLRWTGCNARFLATRTGTTKITLRLLDGVLGPLDGGYGVASAHPGDVQAG